MNTYPKQWYDVSREHTLTDASGMTASHLFFDTTPEFKTDERTVNAIIVTPENSAHAYALDLNSGQRFYSHTYCKQKDVWNTYSGSIDRPIFSIGYIPRVLDQLGEPQKVIVWSRNKKYAESASTNFHRIKLVAAYIEQICPEGNCLGKNNWLSRLVFIGVDAEDADLVSMKNMEDFKKHFDWETSKVYLANLDGRNFMGDLTFPATRIGGLISYEEAFDYFKKRAIFMTDVELKKVQKGCHILYDKLWSEAGAERDEDRPAMNTEALNAKIKLQDELKSKKLPVGYAERFKKFTKKYFNEISTCEKFVYHGNINGDREKFWFFSHVGIYYRLHREGYFFDCRNKVWQRNVLNEKGEPVYNIKRDIDDCKVKDLDQAMDYLPNFLSGLRGEKDYYRFIDYDNYPFGTHQKLYSWVKIKNRKLDCSSDPNAEVKKDLKIYPEDVSWKEKNIKDLEQEMKIIR